MPNVTACFTCDPATQDAAHPSECPKPFDYHWLLQELDGNPAAIAKLLKIFIWETRQDFAELAAEIGKANVNKVAIIAHRIKGGAAAIGAASLRDGASQLEAAGRAGKLAEAADCLRRLQSEFERFRIYFAETLLLAS